MIVYAASWVNSRFALDRTREAGGIACTNDPNVLLTEVLRGGRK